MYKNEEIFFSFSTRRGYSNVNKSTVSFEMKNISKKAETEPFHGKIEDDDDDGSLKLKFECAFYEKLLERSFFLF